MPEADDDCEDRVEFDTLDQLRDDLRERLGEIKEREASPAVRDRVLDAMVDSVDVDIPETLIVDETEHRVAQAKERAERPASRSTRCSRRRAGTRPAARGLARPRDPSDQADLALEASREPRRSRSTPTTRQAEITSSQRPTDATQGSRSSSNAPVES